MIRFLDQPGGIIQHIFSKMLHTPYNDITQLLNHSIFGFRIGKLPAQIVDRLLLSSRLIMLSQHITHCYHNYCQI